MIKLRFAALLLFPLLVMAQKEGQQQIDSLLKLLPRMKADTTKVLALTQVADNYQNIDPAKGLEYGQKSLMLAQNLHWIDGIAAAYKSIGVNYFVVSNFPKALECYNKGLAVKPGKRVESHIFNDLGVMYTYQSNFAKALEYNFRSLKIRESIHDLKGIAVSSLNIGLIYSHMGKNTTAIHYYENALRYSEKINNQLGISRILFNLGNIYDETSRNPEAIAAYRRGMLICENLGDLATKAKYLNALANSFLDQKNYPLALEYCNASLLLSQTKTHDRANIARCQGILGQIYFEMAQQNPPRKALLEKSRVCFETSLAGYQKLNMLDVIAYNYGMLSDIATLNGNDKSALALFKKSVVYKDSIFNNENRETIKNLEDRRSIELRDKEIKINRLKLENKEKQKRYFIFGLGLLAIIAGLLLYQNNSRKKANRKLNLMNNNLDQANKVKIRLLGILNHDLRSPVNSFIHFIQFQRESPELLDEATKNRIEGTTLASAKNLLDSMEDILLWTKNQMENFAPQPENIAVELLFDDLKKHFSSIENVKISFENPEKMRLFTDANYLKTILRNLIANAVKALDETQNAVISINAFSENGKKSISVSDNGPGGTEAQFHALYDDTEIVGVKSGLGLHLIRDLAKAIGCTITADTKPGFGTAVTVLFP